METGIKFENVARLACSRRGWPFDTLTTEQWRQVRDEVNEALKWAWESYWWEDAMEIRQIQLRPEYDNAKAYAAGDEVYFRFSDGYYVALAASTGNPPAGYITGEWITQLNGWARVDTPVDAPDWVEAEEMLQGDWRAWGGLVYQCREDHVSAMANNPATEPFYWGVVPDFDWTLPYADTLRPVIGRVRTVTVQDPRMFVNADKIEFTPVAGGIRLINPPVNRPWIEYRVRCPELDGENWEETTAYSAASAERAVWGL